MDDQKRIASKRSGDDFGDTKPAIQYFLDDHLGSSSVVLKQDGSLINREEYYPFGETSFGSFAKKRYRFCGKERDEESGLYFYGMRYYAPWLCRFVSVDPLAEQYDFYTPYQYTGNKPISAIDLDGAEPFNFQIMMCIAEVYYEWKFKLQGATKDYIDAKQGTGDFNHSTIPKSTREINNIGVKVNSAKTYTEAFLFGAEIGMEAINSIPGVDIVGDPLLTLYYGKKGDYSKAGSYATASALPFVTGLAANSIRKAGEGLQYTLSKNDLDLRGTGVRFRDALDAAFEATGVPRDQFIVTKWGENDYGKDYPVEFRAKGGAEVSIDIPKAGDQGPDAPHVGWQRPGKRGQEGGAAERGHIILDHVPATRTKPKN